MAEYPRTVSKALADHIARLCSKRNEDSNSIVRLLRLMIHSEASGRIPQSTFSAMASLAKTKSNRVGIWEFEDDGRQFVRTYEARDEWHLWATVGRIGKKRAKRRIVLIGESVARGFFYDPSFTPAMVLEKLLNSVLGEDEIEVIDLARSGLRSEAGSLAKSAALLDPDLVLMFCGNNWWCYPLSPSKENEYDLPYIEAALREQWIYGLKLFTERRIAENITTLIEEISTTYRSKGIPVVWIIPEVNLADWRDPDALAPHLSAGANLKWLDCRHAAIESLKLGKIDKAFALANELITLDQGVVPTGFYILAECHKRLGNAASARSALEAARDSLIWDDSGRVLPRAYSVTQNTIREESNRQKTSSVDLPDIFRQYLGDELPGRQLFLDYCHLTSRGIQVSMAATAASVLKVLVSANLTWRSLVGKWPGPSNVTEARARLSAAFISAQWEQSPAVIRDYCTEAIELSRDVIQVMDWLIDSQTRNLPRMMCRFTEDFIDRQPKSAQKLMFYFGTRPGRHSIDIPFIDEVNSCLGAVGEDRSASITRLRCEEHGRAGRKTDLLHPYYASSTLSCRETLWSLPEGKSNESHYYKAYSSESVFTFVSDGSRSLCLSLTCRLSRYFAQETVSLRIDVNDECNITIPINSEWVTWDITIPAERQKIGANHVRLQWPLPKFQTRDSSLSAILNNLAASLHPELYSTFGEIYSFVAVAK
jgi:hypothetical protein